MLKLRQEICPEEWLILSSVLQTHEDSASVSVLKFLAVLRARKIQPKRWLNQ
jgi:hypothetical protein